MYDYRDEYLSKDAVRDLATINPQAQVLVRLRSMNADGRWMTTAGELAATMRLPRPYVDERGFAFELPREIRDVIRK